MKSIYLEFEVVVSGNVVVITFEFYYSFEKFKIRSFMKHLQIMTATLKIVY